MDLKGPYVALGDSYSAGEGLAPYEQGTQDLPAGDRCHRSASDAYPLLLRLTDTTTLDFRACSGAKIVNVFDLVQDHSGVPDSDGLQAGPGTLSPDVKLVTLTMSGNDLGFANVLGRCFTTTGCMEKPYLDQPTLTAWLDNRLAQIGTQLLSLYQRIATAAQSARILVLGYPLLLPTNIPSALSHPLCHVLFNRLGNQERDQIRSYIGRLDDTIQTDAAQAGIEYVDTASLFSGHGVCTGDAWIRFVGIDIRHLLDSGVSHAISDGTFHPNGTGQTMFARIVSCFVQINAAPQRTNGSQTTSTSSPSNVASTATMQDCVFAAEPSP